MFLVRLILKSCIQMSFQGSYIIYLCFGTSNIKFWGFRMKKNELEHQEHAPAQNSARWAHKRPPSTARARRVESSLTWATAPAANLELCIALFSARAARLQRTCGQSGHFSVLSLFRFFWPTRLPQACLRPKTKLNTYRNRLKTRLIRVELV